MMGVNGSCSANQRTPAGIAAVGTNALLMNGRNCGISDRLFAPAGVLACSPKAIVSQVRARVSMTNSPSAASHSSGVALVRKPSPIPIATTRTPLIRVRIVLPSTWPVSTEVRLMAMVRNRLMMPSPASMQTFTAVAAAAAPTVITRMPGSR
jgi:hypothetical protein